MDVETFAEWLRRQGLRVAITESSHWFNRGPGAYQAFPWHRLITPSPGEVEAMLRREHGAVARYSMPAQSTNGTASYDVVLASKPYGASLLARTVRKQVHRGLESCVIGRMSFHRYATDGWRLELETAGRQGRLSRGSKERWERLALAAADLPGFEAWGAEVEGQLAAALMFAQVGDCATMLYQQSTRAGRDHYANHALSFTVTEMLTRRPGVSMIHYSLRSLDAPETVDDFKLRLGYARRDVRACVAFHPLVAPFVTRATYGLLVHAHHRWQHSAVLSKGEGLFRLYLDGKQPVSHPLDAPGHVPGRATGRVAEPRA